MEFKSRYSGVQINGDTAFLAGGRALVNMPGFETPKVKPSVPEPKIFLNPIVSGVIPWGYGNNHPQIVVEKASKSPETLSLLEFGYSSLYGEGIVAEIYAGRDGQGNHKWETCIDPEVTSWMDQSNIPEFFYESCIDATWFGNNFEELIKTRDGKYIYQITHQESAFSRYMPRDKNGIIQNVALNANWPIATASDDYSIQVPLIDRYDGNRVDSTRASKAMKLIYNTSFSSPGKVDYQTPGWQSILDSGWMDVAISIPLYKKALMRNQMTIKYHIEVPFGFWVAQAKDRLDKVWVEMLPDEKTALRKVILDEMNEFLSNIENTGKSWLSTYGINPADGKEILGVKISTIEDKLKEGAYLEDSQEASAHIIRSLGLTPAIVGHFTGKGMGAGSGSDARIHMNILNNRLAPKRHILTQPLNFCAQYNGWIERLPGFRFRVKEFTLETLDVNHSTTQTDNYAKTA